MAKHMYTILFFVVTCFENISSMPADQYRESYVTGITTQTFNSRPRIIGGKDVSIEEYPYQVALMYFDKHFCGGSVINEYFILTAAHCFDNNNNNNNWIDQNLLKVLVGSSSTSAGSGQMHNVADMIPHPRYTMTMYTIDYDIAILKLETKLVFSTSVRPIPLASSGTTLKDGLSAVATGWGVSNKGGGTPDQLQAVTLPIMSLNKCKNYLTIITERFICAGYYNNETSIAEGDSGGPLVASGMLVGVSSFGRGPPGTFPAAFSSVAAYRDFIDSTINTV